jgi:hypothetical protein
MNEEAGRFDVQLFGDIFADLDEIVAALTALTGVGLVPVFDTRQMVRQGLTTGAGSGWTGTRRLGQLRQFRLDGGLVDLGGFVEQIRLTTPQGLALLAEAETLMVRQLQSERLDLELGGVEVLL